MNKVYRIKFEEGTKYNKVERTVDVTSENEMSAQYLVHEQFGSITPLRRECGKIILPHPSNKISILSCDEVDKNGKVIKKKKPRKKKEDKKENDKDC